jgi:hypothetical protein
VIQILATKSATEPEKKVSSKVTKAQRRAQQAEFNRQLWAEAYVVSLKETTRISRLMRIFMAVKPRKHSTLLKRAPMYPSSRTSSRPSRS